MSRHGEADPARLFAALGDDTRLDIVRKLAAGPPRSISELNSGSRLSRQAFSKHLRVLERAQVLRGARHGREMRFELLPQPLTHARAYLEEVSRQWDNALARLKAFVETPENVPSCRVLHDDGAPG